MKNGLCQSSTRGLMYTTPSVGRMGASQLFLVLVLVLEMVMNTNTKMVGVKSRAGGPLHCTLVKEGPHYWGLHSVSPVAHHF